MGYMRQEVDMRNEQNDNEFSHLDEHGDQSTHHNEHNDNDPSHLEEHGDKLLIVDIAVSIKVSLTDELL